MSENLRPGDRFTVIGLDGTEHHDTVHSIRYTSAEPEILRRPTGWRKVLRGWTPRRWRKPLPVARPYKAAEYEVIGVSDVARRADLARERMFTTVKHLMQHE
jgi:hypothetical protein